MVQYTGPKHINAIDMGNLSTGEYQYQSAMICLFEKEEYDEDMDEEALEHFQIAADEGHPIAQTIIAECYRDGNGVEKNLVGAINYYNLAANQNYAPALDGLGYCYYQGVGVEYSYEKAVKY